MGGLASRLRWTWVMMLIGTLALTGVGIPHLVGFAGFHSKDAIVEATAAAQTDIGQYAFWMLVVAAFMTSFYSWRLMFMTFHGRSRAEPEVLKKVHESPWVILITLIILADICLRRSGWAPIRPEFFIFLLMPSLKRCCFSAPALSFTP